MRTDVKVLFAGVGGQGVISVARLLGRAAVSAGLEVRVGQLHGMAQRGGSVEATVCFGPDGTGFVSPGEADVLVGLEPLEAARAVPFLSAGALVLVERDSIPLPHRALYPELDELLSRIAAVAGSVHTFEAAQVARDAGDPRSANLVLLGALTAFDALPVGADVVRGALLAEASERLTAASLRAFDRGCGLGRREAGREAGEELARGTRP